MYLKWIQVKQVRNLHNVKIFPSPRLNFLIGKNASGKTAFLEAIYLLARARSFRTPGIEDVIQSSFERMQVSALVFDEQKGDFNIGIERGYGQLIIKNNGRLVKSVSDQARNIPLILITPDTNFLVTGGPRQRRHWLDWAMFHVERDYLNHWKSYMKALKQRNSLLKRRIVARDIYRGWEAIMLESGSYLQYARQSFLAELLTQIHCLAKGMCWDDIEIILSPGWSEKKSLEQSLIDGWQTDFNTGYTKSGPHRADFKIVRGLKDVTLRFSRGQMKLLTCIIMLAQARVIATRSGNKPVVLIDDYHSELDLVASEYLLSFLADGGFQVFITDIGEHTHTQHNLERHKLFHVEHDKITEAAALTA